MSGSRGGISWTHGFSRARWRRAAGRAAVSIAASAAVLLLATSAGAIPAFARKYGLRCSACHEAWPALNDFGRAFRDNGYQLMSGHDEPTSFAPQYWPVSVRLTPHYEFNSITNQPTDQGEHKIS